MAGPTNAQLGAVRTLIESAPEHALRSLKTALATAGDGPMAEIRRLVEAEQRERTFRDAVFAPVAPMFKDRPGRIAGPRFSARTPFVLWAELKRRHPELVAQARAGFEECRFADDPTPREYDKLTAAAAELLRAEPQAVFSGQWAQAASEQLASFLDLTPVARRVLARLPEWLGKATEERVAQLKLMFRDAVAVAWDATPRMLEIVLANLAEPQTILRVVSTLTDHASDRYLSSSELATFGERLLDDVDARVAAVKAFNAEGGAKAAEAAAEDVNRACAILAEIEGSVELSRDGPWGARVAEARKSLAANVEARLHDVEFTVSHALPRQTVRVAGRMTRPAPKVEVAPDARAVDQARAMTVFLEKTRVCASAGGYGALRTAVADTLTERLNAYADEVLHLINTGEAPDPAIARRYAELAAEFLGHAEGPQAAQIVRRRLAAAGEAA
jgi:hypothetical protein